MKPSETIESVSARRFENHDPCRFRPSVRRGVRVVCRLTQRCTLLCEHCLANAAGNVTDRDLGLDQWTRILSELKEVDAHKVLLTGGEPLLFDGLVELTRSIASMGISTDLNSTLWFMTPELARRLADSGLTEASISLEGTEQVHDAMHGREGAYRRLVAGVRMLQEAGILVDGSMCVTPTNVDLVEELIMTASELKLGSFTISRMLPVGHGLRYAGPVVADEDLAQLYETLTKAREGSYEIPVRCVGLLGAPCTNTCQQGQSIIGIRADGSLTPCVLTRDEVPGVPDPRDVGLATAVEQMRIRLSEESCRYCY